MSDAIPSNQQSIARFRPTTVGTAFTGMACVGNPKAWGGQQVDYVLASDHDAAFGALQGENERLRKLVKRGHSIIGIREAAMQTHKGAAWLEQASGELKGSAVEVSHE